MTSFFLSVVLAITQTPAAQTPSAPVLTLDEAVAIARRNAFAIATQSSRVRQSQDLLNEARGTLGPRVVLNASDTHPFRTGGLNGATFNSADVKSAGVTLNMPVDI